MPPSNAPHPSRRQWLALAAAGAADLVRAQPPDPFWRLLRDGGCVVLMRHAQTEPGVGDPPNFNVNQCSTQRNLSAEGREQARRTGAAFQREGIRLDEVRSSAWCRCVDTAMLAFKKNTVWSPLNAFVSPDDRDEQTREVLDAVQGWPTARNLALVTHHINVAALTGQTPAMGEILLTRPGRDGSGTQLRVVARQVF